MASEYKLTDTQLHALLDILSHQEVYSEIEDFRFPGALSAYGPPFESKAALPSSSPALQALISRFVLKLPGLQDVSDDFWQQQLHSIIEDFEKAELSESYDKGHLGIRKTLATAISALMEYPVRGILAGFDEPQASAYDQTYNIKDARDLQRAFKDLMHQVVYGDVLDSMFRRTAQTDKLTDHEPIVQAAHEFGLVNLASFLHYTLIISPKGQNLLSLIDHTNKLIPYALIRQTLKIGNVASMMSAMVRVILAKMSVASVTNWMGWTNSADEGMNLLQNIIWTVMHWDIRDLKSRATKIEKSKEAPSKEQLNVLKAYLQKSRTEHEAIRERSQQQAKSIVLVLLNNNNTLTTLSEAQHKNALEYLAIQLSIRDREQIIRVMCHSQPDHLTQSVRDLVTAYEPMIRHVHNAVDLSDTVYDFEVFLRDMIKLAKMPDPSSRSSRPGRGAIQPPTVGDFVQLLKKHQHSSHKFLHQTAKNGKELTRWFYDYSHQAASHFRQSDAESRSTRSDSPPNRERHPGAGDLTGPLQDLCASIPAEDRASIAQILDQHSLYLSKLHEASAARLHAVVISPPSQNPLLTSNDRSPQSASEPSSRTASPAPMQARSNSAQRDKDGAKSQSGREQAASVATEGNPGPGAYLARWQNLLDNTLITPAETNGGIRGGASSSVVRGSTSGPDAGLSDEEKIAAEQKGPEAVDGKGAGADSEDEEDEFHEARERLDELGLNDEDKVAPPDVSPVIDTMLSGFREIVAKRCCTW